MTGVKRAAVVAGVAVAVALTLARASEGDAMTRGFVQGAESVAAGVRWGWFIPDKRRNAVLTVHFPELF